MPDVIEVLDTKHRKTSTSDDLLIYLHQYDHLSRLERQIGLTLMSRCLFGVCVNRKAEMLKIMLIRVDLSLSVLTNIVKYCKYFTEYRKPIWIRVLKHTHGYETQCINGPCHVNDDFAILVLSGGRSRPATRIQHCSWVLQFNSSLTTSCCNTGDPGPYKSQVVRKVKHRTPIRN